MASRRAGILQEWPLWTNKNLEWTNHTLEFHDQSANRNLFQSLIASNARSDLTRSLSLSTRLHQFVVSVNLKSVYAPQFYEQQNEVVPTETGVKDTTLSP